MSTKPVIARMHEILRPLGFTRYKALWNRRFDSFADVIDVQKSKAGDTITINAGVLHPGVHLKCWGTEPAAVVEEPSCTVRTRIGELVEGKELWWRLDDEGIIADIGEKLSGQVLPFLDRMHSAAAMEQFLTTAQVPRRKYPPPIIYLAILRSEQGDITAACTILAELYSQTVSGWRTRIKQVAKRLECSGTFHI